jgi:putative ABC transport system permease protein
VWKWLFRKRAREQEINAELQYHQEMLSRDGVERGLTSAEAEAAARRRLGNATSIRETVSEIWGWPAAESIGNDIHYALRSLRKNPRFTLAAVLSLGLGIGMATAIFTLVNSILLHSLPYADADRLVMLWSENKVQGWDHEKMSYPEMLDWEKTSIFDRVVGFVPNMGTITAPGEPELVHGYAVTPGALAMLGVRPLLGRSFTPQEERRGGAGAVILRYNVWQRRFGGDPNVVGQTLLFNDTQRTIAGVMPPEFEFFNRESDLIFPAYLDPSNFTYRGRFLRVMARLKSGLSLREAQTRVNVVAANLAAQYPDSNRGWTISLVPLPIDTAGPIRPALLMLMGAVGMVMLIACSNVACLLLAQAGARSKELAVRLALGATRWRLARQVLIESLLLALLGGVFGLGLSESAIRYSQNILPDRYSSARYLLQLDQIHVDGWVLAFAGLVVLVSAGSFGLAPALRAAKSDLNEGLKETGRGSSSGRRARRGQNLLVVAQLAVAVVLVIGAGLLIKSFARLYEQGPGFRPDNLKTVDVQLPAFELQGRSREQYQKWTRTNYELVMDRIGSLPGIEAIASVNDLPVNGFYWLNDFTLENRAQRDPSDSVRAIDRTVWPAYFETMDIPLLSGRYLSRRDTPQPLVVVINDAFVKHYLDGQNPIGRRVKQGPPQSLSPWHTIIGVVAGERSGGMDEEPRPMIYYSASQYPQGFFHLIVRSHADLAATVALLRSELKKINPKIAPYAPTTFDTLVLDSTWRVRCSMLLLGVLAAVSLITAIVGVYGVIDYGVSERASEIGIRMALGASGGDVLKMITWEGVRVAAAGIALGLGLASVLSRLLSTLLFNVRPIDGWIYAGVAALLVAVSALASFTPAQRGARLDPISTLRHQ